LSWLTGVSDGALRLLVDWSLRCWLREREALRRTSSATLALGDVTKGASYLRRSP